MSTHSSGETINHVYQEKSSIDEGTFVTPGENTSSSNEQVLGALYENPEHAAEVNATATDQPASVGEITGDEKLYAFASVDENDPSRGIKGSGSDYYLTEQEVRNIIDKGYLDFENNTINRQAIREEYAIPESNRIDCLVEVGSKNRTAYLETQVGEAETGHIQHWATGESGYVVETLPGGGTQVHPDRESLDRDDPNTLPIADWSRDGQSGETADFRDWTENQSRETERENPREVTDSEREEVGSGNRVKDTQSVERDRS
jgi:hypothetical protein